MIQQLIQRQTEKLLNCLLDQYSDSIHQEASDE